MSTEPPISNGSAKKRVSYYYDNEVGNYHYGQQHPMKVLNCIIYII